MPINQKANVDVTLNDEQAKRKLEQLQGDMKKLISLCDKTTQEGNIKGFLKIVVKYCISVCICIINVAF